VVVGQGALVTILQGVGINPAAFFVAMFIAFALTLGYVFTFTELSLMMPKAGGISTYTEVAIGHLPAIVITIGGYLGLAIFAGAADLFLLDYIFDVLYPDTFGNIGLWIYIIIIILNILGVEVFSSVQNVLAFTMLAALLIVGIVGVSSSEVQDIPFSDLLSDLGSLDWSVLSFGFMLDAAFDFHEWDNATKKFERIVDPEKLKEYYKKNSPITYVAKDNPPILLIHGDQDKLVPIQQSELLISKLKDLGVPNKLYIAEGKGHGFNFNNSDENEYGKVLSWFEKYLLEK
ncbi:MAG TPA: amino acid permease, partial [Gillisia sp.]|nr:amino acid permease [Gillisia sp.]